MMMMMMILLENLDKKWLVRNWKLLSAPSVWSWRQSDEPPLYTCSKLVSCWFAGMRLGNMYCEPLMTSSGHKITSRQRWTPTPVQLQILERIFEQGNGTPSKQKIKEITSELGQHGQISESNVYNWFQNRRARSKRKQQNTAPTYAESEVETDVESPKDKKTRPVDFQSLQTSAPLGEDMCFQSPDQMSSELHFLDPNTNKADAMFPSNGSLKPARSFSQMSFYEGMP